MLGGIHTDLLVTAALLFLTQTETQCRAENNFSLVTLPEWRTNSEYVTKCFYDRHNNVICDWTRNQLNTSATGDVAVNILESGPLGLEGEACLEFWYLAPVAAKGSELSALLKSSVGEVEIWTSPALPRDSWRQVFVPLNITEPGTQVVFKAAKVASMEGCTFNQMGVRRGSCGQQCETNTELWTDSFTRCLCTDGQLSCSPSQCPEGQICGPQREGISGIYPYGTCSIQSKRDSSTFDGALFRFMNSCTYTLAEKCSFIEALPMFSVEVVNEQDWNSSLPTIQRVNVRIGIFRVSLIKSQTQRVVVNGIWRTLPLNLNSSTINIMSNPSAITLGTSFGLSVSYDNAGCVHLNLPSAYSDHVCGLCGNFNHLRGDDFRWSNGTDARGVVALAESWHTRQTTSSCEVVLVPHQCDPVVEANYASELYCGSLLSATGPFADCFSVVEVESYFRDCVIDMCSTDGDPAVLCETLTAYTDICQEAGVTIPTWRNSTLCPVQCGENSHYNSCANGCPEVCSSLDAVSSCGSCEERCECDHGYKLSGGKCVPAEDCGCWYNGKHYEKGEKVLKGECVEQCQCMGNNNMQCNAMQCTNNEVCKVKDGVKGCFPLNPSTCNVYGDPHYITFDGMAYNFQGGCKYTLTSSCGGDSSVLFTVIGHNMHPPYQNYTRSKLEAVSLQVDDLNVMLNQSSEVHVNNVSVQLPYSINGTYGSVWVHMQNNYIVLESTFGLRLVIDGQTRLFLQVDERHKYGLCGLCGTYSDQQDDDFITPEGQNVTHPFEFGDSWRVQDGNECTTHPNDPRLCDYDEENNAYDECYVLLGEAFRSCHEVLHPSIYLTSCVYDFCATSGDRYTLCESLKSYAIACQVAGVELPEWQTNTACDNPTITTTTLSPIPSTPDQISCPIDCTFEDSLCGWEQLIEDSFDWTRNSGPTPSNLTGPDQDHTTGAGFYMYIDGSNVSNGDSARLLSSTCYYNGSLCLHFWYHMYGSATAMALNIYLLKNTKTTKLWSMMNNQGSKWHPVYLDIKESGPFQIIAEGIRGSNNQSDVAIDDIYIDVGSCSGRMHSLVSETEISSTTAEILPSHPDLTKPTSPTTISLTAALPQTSTSSKPHPPPAFTTTTVRISAATYRNSTTTQARTVTPQPSNPDVQTTRQQQPVTSRTILTTTTGPHTTNPHPATTENAVVETSEQPKSEITGRPKTTASPEHQATTARPQLPTTAKAQPTTAQPPSTAGQQPKTTALTGRTNPLTTAKPKPPATARPQPPTTLRPQLPTTARPQPLTTAEPKIPTTARPSLLTTAKTQLLTTGRTNPLETAGPRPITTVRPNPLTSAKLWPPTSRPQPPSTAKPKPPATVRPPPSTTAKSEPPATARPQPPTTLKPKPSTTARPQPPTTLKPKPSTARPQPPTTLKPKPSTAARPQPLTTVRPKPLTTGRTNPLTTAKPKPPATLRPQPPTTLRPLLPTTARPQTSTTAEPKPPATTGRTNPLTTAKPKPPATGRPQPPTTAKPQPEITARPQPATTRPQPTTETVPQPQTTVKPKPQTTSQTEPLATNKPQPDATSTIQPPATARPQPATTGGPKPPTTLKPQPLTTAGPQTSATVRPNLRTTGRTNPSTTAKPKPPATARPQPPTTLRPQLQTTARPQPLTTVRPKPLMTAKQQSSTKAEAKPPATARPSLLTTVKPQLLTTGRTNPVETAGPKPITTVRPKPLTSAKLWPPTSRPQPPSTAEPKPPATARPQPSTTVKSEPPATARPQPSTTAKSQLPATTRPQPPTTLKPKPSTTARPQPITTVRPNQLTTGRTNPLTTAKPKPPATLRPQPPTTLRPLLPTTARPQLPTTAKAQPTTAQPPSTAGQQPKTTALTTGRTNPLTTAKPKPPATARPNPLTTAKPKPPATTGRTNPLTTAKPKPPATGRPQPPTTAKPQPEITARPQPATARPQPTTETVPQPQTTAKPKPQTTSQTEPLATNRPQPDATSTIKPPATARPQPATTGGPKPPTTVKLEPQTTAKQQPPTTTGQQPQTETRPHQQTTYKPHPTTGRPQPMTSASSQSTTARPKPSTTLVPTPSCPQNSHYTTCIPACNPTCTYLNGPPRCSENEGCVQGCICNDGFVQKGKICVPIQQCGCLDRNGDTHQFNEVWYTNHCSQKCECEKHHGVGEIDCDDKDECDGNAVCLQNEEGDYYCQTTDFNECTIEKDNECRTFDKMEYDFEGEHSYVLVQTKNLPNNLPDLYIVGINTHTVHDDDDSHGDSSSDKDHRDEEEDDDGDDDDDEDYDDDDDSKEREKHKGLQELKIRVHNHTVEFKKKRRLIVDGRRTHTPVSPTAGLKIYKRSSHIYLKTDFGLRVEFDGRSSAEIILPRIYKRKVGGLCGNFDGQKWNDWMKPDGTRATSVHDFGESWRV